MALPLWALGLLRSRLFWGAILMGGVLVGGKLYVDSRYDAGLSDGRAECRTAALTAELAEARRLQKDAEERAEKESVRADRAYETAARRTVETRNIVETAQAQANADEVCLTEEVTDAIRALE